MDTIYFSEQIAESFGEVRVFGFSAVSDCYFRWNVNADNGYESTCVQELKIEGF